MAVTRNNTGTLNVNNANESSKYLNGTSFEHVIRLCKSRKSPSSAPDFRGRVLIEGRYYYVSGWYKPDHDFVSLSFTPCEPTGNK